MNKGLKTLNYNYLRYFSVLAQVEHYTLAAARLEISQPSLSSAIHNLETELGVKLFEKTGRNIRLTEEGRYFQKKVDAAMAELNTATHTLRASRERAPIVVRLGLVSGTLQGIAAELMADYLAHEKRFRFHLTEDAAENLMDMVRRQDLHVAIVDTAVRDRSLHFRRLRQRDFCVALPSGHPLAEMESINPHLLTDLPQIAFHTSLDRSFQEWASESETHENILCQVNTVQGALDLVAAGAGFAVIPDECVPARPDIACIRLENRHQALYLCMLYDRWLAPPVWEFVERLVRTIRQRTT